MDQEPVDVSDFVKAYYDASGTLCKRVIVTNQPNYNHAVHDNLPGEQSWFGVVIDKPVYDAFPDPLNVGGLAVFHDMNKAVAVMIAQSNPVLSAKLTANAAALDAQIAANAKAIIDAQAISVAAWNALSPAQQQALNALNFPDPGAVVLPP